MNPTGVADGCEINVLGVRVLWRYGKDSRAIAARATGRVTIGKVEARQHFVEEAGGDYSVGVEQQKVIARGDHAYCAVACLDKTEVFQVEMILKVGLVGNEIEDLLFNQGLLAVVIEDEYLMFRFNMLGA